MEKSICPVCGEQQDADTCPECEEKKIMEKQSPDREGYLNARDYSAPENYPGY